MFDESDFFDVRLTGNAGEPWSIVRKFDGKRVPGTGCHARKADALAELQAVVLGQ